MPNDMVAVRRPKNNQFSEEPQVSIGRSQFDRSHALKTTFNASYLYPIYVDEVLPGDTFTMSLNGFCRVFSPLDAPIMDNIELETFFFFVPNRLVWENWKYFMGEHTSKGAQDTTYTIPILEGANAVDHDESHGITDRFLAAMGLPDGLIPDNTDVNALPFRAYNLIYNEWFRDQNLIDEITVETDNGPDDVDGGLLYLFRKSAKKHDYFTACLPYLQKGDASTATLTGTAQVAVYDGDDGELVSAYMATSGLHQYFNAGGATLVASATPDLGPDHYMYADMSLGTASIDINELRESVAIQRLLERDARGGTRYTELIKSHFGVTNPDFRLQRPEYLGGGKSFINVSAVANASGVDSTNSVSGNDEAQGELRGVAAGSITGHGWAKSFTEHGYVIGIIRARGDITYHQGLERMWSRSTRYDFYMPALANLGEQAVLNKELYVKNDGATTDDDVFGYQERWTEYRYKKSNIAGYFNPATSGSLDFWHLAQDFADTPTLSNTFIEDATPMTRVVTTTDAENFLLDLWFNLKCARPMPVHSIPSLIGFKL